MKKTKSDMYTNTVSWNPFVGCSFQCKYCTPSFQAQLKRRGKNDPECGSMCYDYKPHTHEARLGKIPSASTVFVAADGDISFCPPSFTRKIIKRIKEHHERCPDKKFLFQSKNPSYFEQFLPELADASDYITLQTTLETNRDEGYTEWSKAPKPSVRYKDFLALKYPNKVVTVEPIMDFDLDVLRDWIVSIKPKYVWLGFNSKRNSRVLKESGFERREPNLDKVQRLIVALEGVKVGVYKHNERAQRLGRGIRVYRHNERASKLKDGLEVRGKSVRGAKTKKIG